MTIRLLVSPDSNPGSGVEHVFEQDVVTFGRQRQNVLVLDDPTKQVSSNHGRIERRGNDHFLIDQASTNGVVLNGVQVTPKTPVQLRVGDLLLVGGLRVRVVRLSSEVGDQTLVTVDPKRVAGELRAALAQTYARLRHVDAPERRAELQRTLRVAISSLTGEQARTVLQQVKASFDGFDGTTVSRAPVTSVAEDLYGAGYAVVRDLAQHCVGDDGFAVAADVQRFGRRLKQTLDVLVQWLAHSIKGRDEFQSQFGADVTMMFRRQSSPLKGGKTAAEICALLLSWRGAADSDGMQTALEEVCRDQSLHQLGLLAGAREAVKAVLARLDPELIAKQRDVEGKGWFSRGSEWDLYRKTHQGMMQEQNRLFEELIAPAINRGYLQAHEQVLQDPSTVGQPPTPSSSP